MNWGANTTSDVSGQGNTGTMTSMSTTTSPTPGKIGQGFKFDGVDDYVNAVVSADISDSTFSYSFWAKPGQPLGGTPFTEDTTGFNGCNTINGINGGIIGDPNAGVNISVGTDGVSVNEHGLSHAPIVASYQSNLGTSWRHISVVSSSATSMVLYVDGINVDTALNTAKTRALILSGLGRKDPCGFQFFKGTIDDVRIYNRALSSEEVKQLYLMGR